MGVKNLAAIVAAIPRSSLHPLSPDEATEAGNKILVDLSQAQWVLPALLEETAHAPLGDIAARTLAAAAAGSASVAESLGDLSKVHTGIARLVAYLRAHGLEPVPVLDGPRFRDDLPPKRPDDDDDFEDLSGRHALERRLAGCPAVEDCFNARDAAQALAYQRAAADDKKSGRVFDVASCDSATAKLLAHPPPRELAHHWSDVTLPGVRQAVIAAFEAAGVRVWTTLGETDLLWEREARAAGPAAAAAFAAAVGVASPAHSGAGAAVSSASARPPVTAVLTDDTDALTMPALRVVRWDMIPWQALLSAAPDVDPVRAVDELLGSIAAGGAGASAPPSSDGAVAAVSPHALRTMTAADVMKALSAHFSEAWHKRLAPAPGLLREIAVLLGTDFTSCLEAQRTIKNAEKASGGAGGCGSGSGVDVSRSGVRGLYAERKGQLQTQQLAGVASAFVFGDRPHDLCHGDQMTVGAAWAFAAADYAMTRLPPWPTDVMQRQRVLHEMTLRALRCEPLLCSAAAGAGGRPELRDIVTRFGSSAGSAGHRWRLALEYSLRCLQGLELPEQDTLVPALEAAAAAAAANSAADAALARMLALPEAVEGRLQPEVLGSSKTAAGKARSAAAALWAALVLSTLRGDLSVETLRQLQAAESQSLREPDATDPFLRMAHPTAATVAGVDSAVVVRPLRAATMGLLCPREDALAAVPPARRCENKLRRYRYRN